MDKIKIIISSAVLITLFSCSNGLESPAPQADPSARSISYDGVYGNFTYGLDALPAATELFELQRENFSSENSYEGTSASPNIILYAQGGPGTTLDEFGYPDVFNKLTSKSDWQAARVRQKQIITPSTIYTKDLSIGEAIKISSWNTAALFKVAKYWKNQGKKVFIITHSYGSFIAEKMILDWKYEDYVEKIIVLAGRLKMPEEVYMSSKAGNMRTFKDGDGDGLTREFNDEVVVTQAFVDSKVAAGNVPVPIPKNITREQTFYLVKNSGKLAAALSQFNYLDIMGRNNIPLSKVLWVAAKKDTKTGYFTDAEIQFARTRGNLVISEKGHDVDTDADVTAVKDFLEK